MIENGAVNIPYKSPSTYVQEFLGILWKIERSEVRGYVFFLLFGLIF